MRIGIDARMLREGQGIGRYIEKLIASLVVLETDHTFVVFLQEKNWNIIPEHKKIEKVRADISWYSWREQLLMPGIIKKARVDLMHFPHINVPIFCPTPYVVTIHDLILIKHSQSATSAASTHGSFRHAIKYYAYRFVLFLITKRSKFIITVSEFVKKDIIKLLKVKSDRVVVTYEAADQPGRSAMDELPSGWKIPYIFYAGNLFPHKNSNAFIELAKRLKNEKPLVKIVMVVQEDFFSERFQKEIVMLGLGDTIKHLGRVTDKVLDALYRKASVYVFPSFEEGFGLPALEAMLRGLPVIASNSSCLPEILGDAALFFDPSNGEQLYDSVIKIKVLTYQLLSLIIGISTIV